MKSVPSHELLSIRTSTCTCISLFSSNTIDREIPLYVLSQLFIWFFLSIGSHHSHSLMVYLFFLCSLAIKAFSHTDAPWNISAEIEPLVLP
ncbi:hypothetical protein JHK87_002520 [Glycine soja]|nr:hypothetical protein JHK87_002520 [Glycine soja]KAG5089910.1 hypothetical protein JHK86_002522 [Glycine max]